VKSCKLKATKENASGVDGLVKLSKRRLQVPSVLQINEDDYAIAEPHLFLKIHIIGVET